MGYVVVNESSEYYSTFLETLSVDIRTRRGVFVVLFDEIVPFECCGNRLVDRLNRAGTVRTEMNANLGGADRLGAVIAGVVFDGTNNPAD